MTDAPRIDRVMRAMAARGHGVVGRAQLVAAGVPAHAIDYRLRSGRLRPLLRGVYGVGPVPVRLEREAAALLACGPGSVLSHQSAAALLGLLPAGTGSDVIHVTTHRGRWRGEGSLRIHRAAHLGKRDVTQVEALAVTATPRTLLDLAATLPSRHLEVAVATALRTRRTRRRELEALLARHPGRRGTRTFRALLQQEGDPAFTRSEAESRFLRLIRRAELPPPDVNARVAGHEVDFFWREERLVVEVDGFAYHASPGAFESDRRRDARLMAAGFRVMRVTWRQITQAPEPLLVRLAQALARLARTQA